MSSVTKISVSLTPAQAEMVRLAVADGDYGSSSEVIRDALRQWRERRENRRAELTRLKALAQEGLDSGPGVHSDIHDIIRAAREEFSGDG